MLGVKSSFSIPWDMDKDIATSNVEGIYGRRGDSLGAGHLKLTYRVTLLLHSLHTVSQTRKRGSASSNHTHACQSKEILWHTHPKGVRNTKSSPQEAAKAEQKALMCSLSYRNGLLLPPQPRIQRPSPLKLKRHPPRPSAADPTA